MSRHISYLIHATPPTRSARDDMNTTRLLD